MTTSLDGVRQFCLMDGGAKRKKTRLICLNFVEKVLWKYFEFSKRYFLYFITLNVDLLPFIRSIQIILEESLK